MRIIGKYEVTQIRAIAECAGETETQDALYIHNAEEPFRDGDGIIFGWCIFLLRTNAEIEEAMQDSYCVDFDVDDDGVYHVH